MLPDRSVTVLKIKRLATADKVYQVIILEFDFFEYFIRLIFRLWWKKSHYHKRVLRIFIYSKYLITHSVIAFSFSSRSLEKFEQIETRFNYIF